MKYTIADIAKICGVSKATVSRIINNKDTGFSQETRTMVLQKMEELGYRPNVLARSISVSSSHLIGMIIPSLENPVQNELLRGAEEYLSQNGYSLILAQSKGEPKQEQEHLLAMVDKRVDGVILCSGDSNAEFLSYYRRYHMPISLIGRTFDREVSDVSITGDNKMGAMMAMRHFFDQGHRHIALLDGKAKGSGTQQRLQGYQEALDSQSIPFVEGLVYNGDYSYQQGFDMTSRLIASGQRFTAILTGGDIIAVGVLAALKEKGLRVPQDVEVIGFDDLELSRIYSPTISTLRKPHYAMASAAAKMLVEVIQGQPEPLCHMTVSPELVLRETTRE